MNQNASSWTGDPGANFSEQDFGPLPDSEYQEPAAAGQQQEQQYAEPPAPTHFVPPSPGAFVPPMQSAFVPPAGRMYAMPRVQPPMWAPPPPQGMGAYFEQKIGGDVLQEALGGLAQVLGGAAAGYLLTKDWAAAAGSGLVVAGLGQAPHVLGSGGSKRAAIGVVCLVGAYLLLKDRSEVLAGLKAKTSSAPWMKVSD